VLVLPCLSLPFHSILNMGDEQYVPVWGDFSEEQLRTFSVSFKCPRETSELDIANAVGDSGYEDLVSVQILETRACILTFLSTASAISLSEFGLEVNGHRVFVGLISEPVVYLTIRDAPVWLRDEELLNSLRQFGVEIGTVRHGSVRTTRGVQIATGVRYLTFRLRRNSNVPSYLRLQTSAESDATIRVRYNGQPRTCRICSDPSHEASACEQNKRAKKRPQAAVSTTSARCTPMSNAPAPPPPPAHAAATATGRTSPRHPPPPPPRAATQRRATVGNSPPPPPPGASRQPRHVPSEGKQPSALPDTRTPSGNGSGRGGPWGLTSRGKSQHDSPDLGDDGYELAKGKHTYNPHVTPASAFALNRKNVFYVDEGNADGDPQVAWAKEVSAKHRQTISERFQNTFRGLSSRRGSA